MTTSTIFTYIISSYRISYFPRKINPLHIDMVCTMVRKHSDKILYSFLRFASCGIVFYNVVPLKTQKNLRTVAFGG